MVAVSPNHAASRFGLTDIGEFLLQCLPISVNIVSWAKKG